MTEWVRMAANKEYKQKTPLSSSSLLQIALLVLFPKPKIIERTYSTNVYPVELYDDMDTLQSCGLHKNLFWNVVLTYLLVAIYRKGYMHTRVVAILNTRECFTDAVERLIMLLLFQQAIVNPAVETWQMKNGK